MTWRLLLLILAATLALNGSTGLVLAQETEDPEDETPEPPPEPPERPARSGDDRNNPAINAAQASSAPSATAPSGRPEYVLLGPAGEIRRATDLLEPLGGTILRGNSLGTVGLTILAVDLGATLFADDFRRQLRAEGIRLSVERNSLFHLTAATRLYAGELMGASDTTGCTLPRTVRVGVVDGPVDGASPALSGVDLRSHSVLVGGEQPASPAHGTGIVSLIVANNGAGAAPGLAQGAKVYSAIAFAEVGGQPAARTDQLAAALDWLAGQDVHVINLSLAGPRNAALETVLATLSARGIILVAATGNDGRDAVSYPASDPHVIAVSAVDARRRLYHQANRGPDVDFVAPGVELLVAEGDETAYRTGTSYAAAIATAVIAQELARDSRSGATIDAQLRQRAEDLGSKGWDQSFGWGLLKLSDCRSE